METRNKKDAKLRMLRKFRNLGWALTTVGGGIIGLPGGDLLERLAVYAIVAGTLLSVGSQALINEMTDENGGFGPFMKPGKRRLFTNGMT
jgi:hypothetical protein|tara:strand:- start:1186 stop:1455 length:270 start_codon:yes stop_codon:yes gene_type:complete